MGELYRDGGGALAAGCGVSTSCGLHRPISETWLGADWPARPNGRRKRRRRHPVFLL